MPAVRFKGRRGRDNSLIDQRLKLLFCNLGFLSVRVGIKKVCHWEFGTYSGLCPMVCAAMNSSVSANFRSGRNSSALIPDPRITVESPSAAQPRQH